MDRHSVPGWKCNYNQHPNHEVSFFKKMIAKMGWMYSEADVVCEAATPKAASKREQKQACLPNLFISESRNVNVP